MAGIAGFLRRLSNHHCCNELLTSIGGNTGTLGQGGAMLVRISWVALSVDEGTSRRTIDHILTNLYYRLFEKLQVLKQKNSGSFKVWWRPHAVGKELGKHLIGEQKRASTTAHGRTCLAGRYSSLILNNALPCLENPTAEILGGILLSWAKIRDSIMKDCNDMSNQLSS
jgi:hypothetical protein